VEAENIITWNLPNWITIVIMAIIGYSILAWFASIIRKRNANVNEPSNQTNLAQGTALSPVVPLSPLPSF